MSQKPTEKQVLREICGEENIAEEVTLLNEKLEKKWKPVLDMSPEEIKALTKNRKTTAVIL